MGSSGGPSIRRPPDCAARTPPAPPRQTARLRAACPRRSEARARRSPADVPLGGRPAGCAFAPRRRGASPGGVGPALRSPGWWLVRRWLGSAGPRLGLAVCRLPVRLSRPRGGNQRVPSGPGRADAVGQAQRRCAVRRATWAGLAAGLWLDRGPGGARRTVSARGLAGGRSVRRSRAPRPTRYNKSRPRDSIRGPSLSSLMRSPLG